MQCKKQLGLQVNKKFPGIKTVQLLRHLRVIHVAYYLTYSVHRNFYTRVYQNMYHYCNIYKATLLLILYQYIDSDY